MKDCDATLCWILPSPLTADIQTSIHPRYLCLAGDKELSTRNKEKISIPVHCAGGQAALPSEWREPKGSGCVLVRSKDQSEMLMKLH